MDGPLNRFHQLSGHLFQGRYKAVLVDSEQSGYFSTLSDYIHLNPVRAGLIGLEEKLFAYRWSSYPWYVAMAGRPSWFESRRVLGELGLEDSKAGRRAYAERMRDRAVEERAAKESIVSAKLDRGWCLGSESFRERVLRLWARDRWIAERVQLGHVSRLSRYCGGGAGGIEQGSLIEGNLRD